MPIDSARPRAALTRLRAEGQVIEKLPPAEGEKRVRYRLAPSAAE